MKAEELSTHVWIPDEKDGFILCKIIDIGCECMTLQPLHTNETLQAFYDNIFPAEEDPSRDVDDNCSLIHLNDGSLLNNCRLRYNRKKFYTYVANILIVINPYEQISGLYDIDMVRKYKGRSLGTLPPHIFAIADKAYRDMMRNHESQSIIISGESGAGKTESQKHIIRFLCESWDNLVGKVEERILEISTILESFGNAKTACNNNSSRFGKFIEIHFNDKGAIAGGFVSHYLLERSRLCRQNARERNYHIFYQLIAGADDQLASKLKLNKPENFNVVICCHFKSNFKYDLIDDYNDFAKLMDAFDRINVSAENRDGVLEIIAAILHLGNVEFMDETTSFRTGCMLKQESDPYLANAAELLGIEAADLRNHLVTRLMQPTRGGIKGTLYTVPLRAGEASAARDALAKAIYSRLFAAIVDKITECMPINENTFSIGVLDTAGFELFEQKLYGIFELLDNESRLPQSSTQHFTTTLHQIHACHPCLMVPRSSRHHRTMRDDEGFIICHYAADVCYDTAQFLDKNSDTLHTSLQCLMQQSSSRYFHVRKRLICELFDGNEFSQAEERNASLGKLVNASVGNKFRSQLDILLQKLRKTGTHFVRCIKPNAEMKSNQFDGAQILTQLKCAGMSSALKVMQRGFPSRISYLSLYNMYQKHLPSRLATLDAQLLCKCLFRVVGLEEKDYKFGLTKAFFRHGKFAEFDKILHQDNENIEHLVECMSSWLSRFRFRKVQFAVISLVKVERLLAYRAKCRIIIQNAVRSYLTYKLYRPRINVLLAVTTLSKDMSDMSSMIEQTNKANFRKWTHMPQLTDAETLQRCVALVNNAKEKLQCMREEARWNRSSQQQEQSDKYVERSELKRLINHEQEKETRQVTECLGELMEHPEVTKQQKKQLLENKAKTCDLSKWRYSDIRNGINSSDPTLSSACKSEYYRRMRAYNEWKERNMASKKLLDRAAQRNECGKSDDHKAASHRYFRIVASTLTNREKHLFVPQYSPLFIGAQTSHSYPVLGTTGQTSNSGRVFERKWSYDLFIRFEKFLYLAPESVKEDSATFGKELAEQDAAAETTKFEEASRRGIIERHPTEDDAASDIGKSEIIEKIIQKQSLGTVERAIVLGDMGDTSGTKNDIQESLIIADQEAIFSKSPGSFCSKKLGVIEAATSVESNATAIHPNISNYRNVEKPTSSTVVVKISITLISGELQVRTKEKHITRRILEMDSGSESGSTNSEGDFVFLNREIEEQEGEGNTEKRTTEVNVNPQECEETNVAKVEGEGEQLDRNKSLDLLVKVAEKVEEHRKISHSILENVRIIGVLTEVLDFQYRNYYGIIFETVGDMNQYVAYQFGIAPYFRIADIFNIRLNSDTMAMLYKNIVHAVVLFARANGFLLLRCIIDCPLFDFTIYEKTDLARELNFLESVYSDVGRFLCLRKRRYQAEFISCGVLFEIVQFIKNGETYNLLAKGVVRTMRPSNFFDPNLLLVTIEDVQKLYEMDIGIAPHLDLLIDERFFMPSLMTAQQQLLMQYIKTLNTENLDKLTDFKLQFEENQKDPSSYNALQAQEMIRNEYSIRKDNKQLVKNLCCQLIFYCDSEWFWSEILAIISPNTELLHPLLKAFRSLPTVTEYLMGRKEPRNKTPLNLLYLIDEILMAVPHREFISRNYGSFIASLCMDQGWRTILNPTTLINKILIPNMEQPIRKVCAAVTIGKLLDVCSSEIAWSFDHIAEQADETGQNIRAEAEEKVEVVRLIGAFYSQYTFPLPNTVHGSRYFYIDLILSKLERRLSPLLKENSFTENALTYLDELVARKEFPWYADYYLTKTLLRKLLASRGVNVPEKPVNSFHQEERIEWARQLLPITYAGVKSKTFFSLALLIDGFCTNLDLECAFVQHLNHIPEFIFVEFLVLFKLFLRSHRRSRFTSLRKHCPGRYGRKTDRNLQEMIKWIFSLVNRVQKTNYVGERVILDAKHRVLHWAEAYVEDSKMLSTDDAKIFLSLSKWGTRPGLVDHELERSIKRINYGIHLKSLLRQRDPILDLMDLWTRYGKDTSELKQYIVEHTPPSSAVKIYKPTRLLLRNPILNEAVKPAMRPQMDKFLNEVAEFYRIGRASAMKNGPNSGSGMYDYARPMYIWSVDGGKLMPFSSMKNKYENVPSDLSELNKKKKIPFDLEVEVGSVWEANPLRRPNFHSRPSLERPKSIQSVNLPITHNEIFRMEIPYDPQVRRPVDPFDDEVSFGASAANIRESVDMQRSYSLPSDLSNLNLPSAGILSATVMMHQRQDGQGLVSECVAQKKAFAKIQQTARKGNMRRETTDLTEESGPSYSTRPSTSHQKDFNVFPLLHKFFESGPACNICGCIDHTKKFCPRTSNHSKLRKALMPMNTKWGIKKDEALENLHRQDSWGSICDEENKGQI
uniref:Uncharacterized protein n=1 Tax=Setaria digitata TaxID=48799 RepID=A0A915Q8B6_9BILA